MIMYLIPGSGGQHCPCPVLLSFLSGFSGKSCPVSVYCPDSVRIIEKKAARCLSVRPNKDEIELPGLSLSLSADICLIEQLKLMKLDKKCYNVNNFILSCNLKV